MATSILITDTSKKPTLKQVLYIRYPIRLYLKNDKDKDKDVIALLNLGRKVNVIYPVYITKLGYHNEKVNIGVHKIDGSYVDIFGIVIADCSVKN